MGKMGAALNRRCGCGGKRRMDIHKILVLIFLHKRIGFIPQQYLMKLMS